MSRGNLNAVLTKIVVDRLKACMKSHGFRSFGHQTFASENEETIKLVGIQKSRDSSANIVKCTLNLGIHSKVLAQLFGYTERPTAWECHCRFAIGELVPVKSDLWWTFSNEREAEQSGTEMVEALENYGLPALSDLDSTEKLRGYWLAGWGGGLTKGRRQEYLNALEPTRRG